MDNTYSLKVNRLARRLRHLRNFSRVYLFQKYLLNPLYSLVYNTYTRTFVRYSAKALALLTGGLPNVAPQKRLMVQATVFGTLMIFSTSITSFSEYSLSYSPQVSYADDISISTGDILVSDESGYLVKINPQTNESNRIGMTDYAVHTVESGETLSVIATSYGVGADTIMWENNINNPNSLRIGQKLMIPPVDGISYKVEKGESLESIAKKFSISSDSIIAQNSLADSKVTIGQQIFLPDAEPIAPPIAAVPTPSVSAKASTRNAAVTRDYRATTYTAAPASSAPTVGKTFIFPTRGKITQGYHAGHYALDIADRSMPPIWAAGGGTVVKASTGTWGGGYGNHVIIDHGNGVKTLYAHMNTVNVSVGQWVNQGDVLGQMGNTGRVYGATGIHLHWEVIVNGVKQYPGNYY